jgi:hypothetical protein
MKRMSVAGAALLLAGLAVFGCSNAPMSNSDWTTLIDGSTGLDNFTPVGDANWRAQDGAIVADKGEGGFLVTKKSYGDFEVRAEFWAEASTNSGIFFRCSDPVKISSVNCYELNIWDTRPDPIYATGAIVDTASVPVPPVYKAGGHWNTYELYAKGNQLTVKLNGTVTVHVQNDKHAAGPFALQFANGANGAPGGTIKWRRVEVRSL